MFYNHKKGHNGDGLWKLCCFQIPIVYLVMSFMDRPCLNKVLIGWNLVISVNCGGRTFWFFIYGQVSHGQWATDFTPLKEAKPNIIKGGPHKLDGLVWVGDFEFSMRQGKEKKAFNGVMDFLVHHLTEMNPKKSLIVNSYFVQFSLVGFSPLVRPKRWATLYDAVIRNSSSVEMLLFRFSCNLSKISNYQPRSSWMIWRI